MLGWLFCIVQLMAVVLMSPRSLGPKQIKAWASSNSNTSWCFVHFHCQRCFYFAWKLSFISIFFWIANRFRLWRLRNTFFPSSCWLKWDISRASIIGCNLQDMYIVTFWKALENIGWSGLVCPDVVKHAAFRIWCSYFTNQVTLIWTILCFHINWERIWWNKIYRQRMKRVFGNWENLLPWKDYCR